NPMHMDEIAARRTPPGAPVVHGMHAVIWALDLFVQKQPDLEISSVTVRFARFIYLEDLVELRLVDRLQTAARLQLVTRGQSAAFVTIGLSCEDRVPPRSTAVPDVPEISTA